MISVYESVCFVWIELPCPRGSSWVGSDLTWLGVGWSGGMLGIVVFKFSSIWSSSSISHPAYLLAHYFCPLSLPPRGGHHSQGVGGGGCQFRYIVSYCSLSCVLVLVAWSLMCHHRHALKLYSYCGRYEQDTRNWTRASPYSPHSLPRSKAASKTAPDSGYQLPSPLRHPSLDKNKYQKLDELGSLPRNPRRRVHLSNIVPSDSFCDSLLLLLLLLLLLGVWEIHVDDVVWGSGHRTAGCGFAAGTLIYGAHFAVSAACGSHSSGVLPATSTWATGIWGLLLRLWLRVSARAGHRERERGGRAHSGLHLAKPLAACPTLDAAAAATCTRSALVAQLIMLIIFISGQPKKKQQQQQCETIAALTICHADGLRDGRAYRCRRSLRSKNQTKSRKGPQKMKTTKAIWMSSPRTEYQMVQKLIGSSGTIATITARLMMRAASDWRLKKLSLKCDTKGGSE